MDVIMRIVPVFSFVSARYKGVWVAIYLWEQERRTLRELTIQNFAHL